jgi:hypothetical protein
MLVLLDVPQPVVVAKWMMGYPAKRVMSPKSRTKSVKTLIQPLREKMVNGLSRLSSLLE